MPSQAQIIQLAYIQSSCRVDRPVYFQVYWHMQMPSLQIAKPWHVFLRMGMQSISLTHSPSAISLPFVILTLGDESPAKLYVVPL